MLTVWDYVGLLSRESPYLSLSTFQVKASEIFMMAEVCPEDFLAQLPGISCFRAEELRDSTSTRCNFSAKTILLGLLEDLVKAADAIIPCWISEKNAKRDIGTYFSQFPLEPIIVVEVVSEMNVVIAKHEVVSVEIFGKLLLSKLKVEHFKATPAKKKMKTNSEGAASSTEFISADSYKVSLFINALFSCSEVAQNTTGRARNIKFDRKISLSSIHFLRTDKGIPVDCVVITEECERLLLQAYLEGLSYALVPADCSAPLTFLMKSPNFDLIKFKRHFGNLDSTNSMISCRDRSTVIRPQVEEVKKPSRLTSEKQWVI